MSTTLHPRGLGIQAAQAYLMTRSNATAAVLNVLADYGTKTASFPCLHGIELPTKKQRIKNALGNPLPSISL
jgi:hypothetical protein